MYDSNIETASSAPLMQCARCGHMETTTGHSECSICAGQLRVPLPSTIDLGIDLGAIAEGVDAIPVHRILARYAQCCDITFTLGENALSPEQIFQPEAILPVVSIEALRIWQSIERRPGQTPLDEDTLGVEFREVNDGFFKYSAYPADIGADLSSTLRMLVFLLAARRTLGMVEGQKIDLAPRIALWDKIDWGSDILPDIPVPEGFDALFHHHEFASRPMQPKHNELQSTAAVPSPFASQGK